MIQQNIAIIALNYVCELGEGPVWIAEEQMLLWLDIKRGEIHSLNTITAKHNFFQIGEMVGSIAPRVNGGFIGGLEKGIGFIDLHQQTVQHIINPEQDLPNRFNDGKCDAAGRFWIGTMAMDESENKGNLYTMETDLSVKRKIDNVTISNGLAWNADNTILYYINTPTDYIFAFDYDIETGDITNQRVVIDLTHEQGHADGMTIDVAGNLWIAFYGGWRVACYNPVDGKLLQQIELPVENVTCCTFGGAELNDLYITTASQNMQPEDLQKQPDAGKLFVVKGLSIKGAPPQKFNG